MKLFITLELMNAPQRTHKQIHDLIQPETITWYKQGMMAAYLHYKNPLSMLLGLGRLVDERLVNVGDHTSPGNSSLDEGIELFISTNGKL